jgi:hypothetical protein
VTDKIRIRIEDHDYVREAILKHSDYIGSQTLATEIVLDRNINGSRGKEVEIDEVTVKILIDKAQ